MSSENKVFIIIIIMMVQPCLKSCLIITLISRYDFFSDIT